MSGNALSITSFDECRSLERRIDNALFISGNCLAGLHPRHYTENGTGFWI